MRNWLKANWLAAWLSAVLLSGLGLAGRVWGNWAYPPLDLFGILTQFAGVPRAFQIIHSIFGLGQGGKIFAFVGVVVLWLGGLTLLGLLQPWVGALALGLLLLSFTPWTVALAYAAAFWLLTLGVRALLRPVRAGDVGRRRTLAGALWGGSALLVAGGLAGIFRSVGGAAQQVAQVGPDGTLPLGVTPQKDFYYVSKNLEAFDPQLSAKDWKLSVGGMVKQPATFTLDDLRQFEGRNLQLTLSCISNPVGGPLISNGIWTGFTVADLLKKVGVQPGAKFIVWKAADGYEESLPLGDAYAQDVLLVYGLNGQPLSQKHGFPLRVLIPGRYGMKQPRWITSIRLTDQDIAGYWNKRGWSKTARVEIMSRIDQPDEGAPTVKAGAPTPIRGVAFGGLKPITKVEVSTDGEQSWQEAKLTKLGSQYAWTLWELPWTPAAGAHQLAVRAFSGDEAQVRADAEALPEGATGYHSFIVTAS